MPTQNSSAHVPAIAFSARNGQKAPTFMLPFMKMPLILYRLGMGWMFGKRLMLLTHKGCRSGKVYQTVLAVLRFDKKTREIFVVSPWSASNWYHNIQAAPAVEVETCRVRYAPIQRTLSPEEIASLFIEFRQQNPIFSRMVARIPGWNIDSSHDEFLALAQSLHGVVFRPR